ncbi:MAG: cytochrome c3 family protein [Rhodospirillales bacterium]|nr:MAG: cytochrome c3 family protein [Rhodospirillales bacterium]
MTAHAHMNLGVLIGAACLAVLGAGAASSAEPAQTIVGSPHDLRNLATLGKDADLCAFCHIPKDGDDASPSWNRAAPAGPFEGYSSRNLDGHSGALSGVSAGCLSCHDGATPLDALKDPANIVLVNPGQTMAAAFPDSMAILGRDLGNHHPASISYGAAGAGGASRLNPPSVSGSRVYVVSTSDGAEIPLYGAAPGTVECASCHDPHDNARGKFLRTANTNSALCVACHDM